MDNHLVSEQEGILNTREAQREEVEGVIDSRIGANIREVPITLCDAKELARRWHTDVGGTTHKKGKGKSNQSQSGRKVDGVCLSTATIQHIVQRTAGRNIRRLTASVDSGFSYHVNHSFTVCHPLTLLGLRALKRSFQ